MRSTEVRSFEIENENWDSASAALRQFESLGVLPALQLTLLTGGRSMRISEMGEEDVLATVMLTGYTVNDVKTAAAEVYRLGVSENKGRRLIHPVRVRYDLVVPPTTTR